MMAWRHATLGFTLVELLITLTLIAIALNGAVYGYRDWQKRTLISEHLNLWVKTLRFARNYALISGNATVLCPSSSIVGCNGNDYAKGWLVFAENSHGDAGRYDSEDRIIARSDAWHSSLTLHSNFKTPVRFNSSGRTNANGRFVLCIDHDPGLMRGIFLIRSGRLRLTRSGELNECLS